MFLALLVYWPQNLVRVLSVRHILISVGLPTCFEAPVRLDVDLLWWLALNLLLLPWGLVSVHAQFQEVDALEEEIYIANGVQVHKHFD